MEYPRYAFGVAVLDNQIYVAGGSRDASTFFSVVERYCADENKWFIDGTMEKKRAQFSLVSVRVD